MNSVAASIFTAKPCPVCGVPNIAYFCEGCVKRELDSRPDPSLMTPKERYQEVKSFRRDARVWIHGLLLHRTANLTGKILTQKQLSVSEVMESHRVWAELGFPQFWLKEGDWDKLAEEARDSYPPLVE